MGGVYKDRKSSGCGLCKPHKHGGAPKHKNRYRMEAKIATEEIRHVEQVLADEKYDREMEIYDACVAGLGCPVCDKDET